MESLRNLFVQYLTIAWRHRWLSLAVAWLICGSGWAAVYFMPNQYEASARLYVDADSVLTPMLRGLAIDDTPANEVDLLQRTLLSRPNLEKLISLTDLDLQAATPAERDALVLDLTTRIKITPQTKSLFTILYRDPNPKLAYSVVQTLLTIFIESKAGANRSAMQNAQAFLQQQIAGYEQKLRDAEQRQAAFKAKYVDILPDANGGASRLEQARAAVRTLEASLEDTMTRQMLLKKELSTTPPLLTTDIPLPGDTGVSRLAQAQAMLQDLLLRDTEQNPDVIAARARVAALKSDPTANGTDKGRSGGAYNRSVSNPVYEQLKVQLVQMEGTIASEKNQLAVAIKERDRLEAMARQAPEVAAQAQNIDRDYSVLRKNYDELLARREATRIASAADTDADKVQLRIIDPPQVPRVPVAPKRALLLAGVLVAGLGGAAGTAFLLVQLDRSFRTVDDLRSFGLPVLGGISLLRAPKPRKTIFAAVTFGAAVLLLCAVFGGLMSRALTQTGVI